MTSAAMTDLTVMPAHRGSVRPPAGLLGRLDA
jgi:hypothetical protein